MSIAHPSSNLLSWQGYDSSVIGITWATDESVHTFMDFVQTLNISAALFHGMIQGIDYIEPGSTPDMLTDIHKKFITRCGLHPRKTLVNMQELQKLSVSAEC